MNAITRKQAVERIKGTAGRWFGVSFMKRSDGTRRDMTCRLGVTTHLRGGPAAYDAREHGLLVVWDSVSEGYRSIPAEGIMSLRIGHETYSVQQEVVP